ncbi:Uncharacterised protein [Micrococcus luteus]|uniref:hypothetical protein n=1 Tax=Micrococcus luteus TaxID=1270 RepID=UPI000DFD8752|nr:hypothetical protein [Micrococcus luteus]STY73314.1 Uncharacterised protein [Micrococcus luteus]
MTANHSHHTAAAADSQGAAAEHAGTATTDPRRDTRPRWGRSERLGGGTGRLMGVSLTVGAVGAALFVLMGCAAAVRYLLLKRRG